MLAGVLRREKLDAATRVLDLCAGSGMLAVTAALAGAGEVVAVDVSRRALLSARVNAALNGVSVRPWRSDLFSALAGRRFDVIVSNPPYVPGDGELPQRGPRRAWEAGPRGRVFLDRICRDAPAHLAEGGVLLLTHSAVCGEDETLESLRRGSLEAEVVFRHRGALGPRLREREIWLRRAGLLDGEHDEVIVVRAHAPACGRRPEPHRSVATSRPASRCLRPGDEQPPSSRAFGDPAAIG